MNPKKQSQSVVCYTLALGLLLSLAAGTPASSQVCPDLTNLAPHGVVTTSSLTQVPFGATTANDYDEFRDPGEGGPLGDTVITLNGDSSPWLEVELAGKSVVETVTLFNRADCCQNFLRNFRLSLIDGPITFDPETGTSGTVVFTQDLHTDFDGESSNWTWVGKGDETDFSEEIDFGGVEGRVVRLEILGEPGGGACGALLDSNNLLGCVINLREIVICGEGPLNPPAETREQLSGIVYMESQAEDAEPFRVNDGNSLTGNLGGGARTLPNRESPWIELHLVETSEIDEVVIYNRNDCCQWFLTNFKVSVLAEPITLTLEGSTSPNVAYERVLFAGSDRVQIPNIGVEGKVVRLEIVGQRPELGGGLCADGGCNIDITEIFVFGDGVTDPVPDRFRRANLAAIDGTVARMSSEAPGFSASAILDGDSLTGDKGDSVRSASGDAMPWLEVALPNRSDNITQVILHNSLEASEREYLTNIRVVLLEDITGFSEETGSIGTVTNPGDSTFPIRGSTGDKKEFRVAFGRGKPGQVVRLEFFDPPSGRGQCGDAFPNGCNIRLSEIEIFGHYPARFPDEDRENVARFATPFLSSLAPDGGFSTFGLNDGNHLVPNDFGNLVAHTGSLDPAPFVELTLAGRSQIDAIRLINRFDCCQNRLANFSLTIFDEPIVRDENGSTGVETYSEVFFPPEEGGHVGISFETAVGGVDGRVVRLEMLGEPDGDPCGAQLPDGCLIMLGEMLVFGEGPETSVVPLPTNLALGGTASMSSINVAPPIPPNPAGTVGLVDNANDGDLDTFVETVEGEESPFWEINLGSFVDISVVRIWNTRDTVPQFNPDPMRLRNFRVSIFELSGGEFDDRDLAYAVDYFTETPGFPIPGQGFDVCLPQGTRGQLVRIEQLGLDGLRGTSGEPVPLVLSMAEVEIFGEAPDASVLTCQEPDSIVELVPTGGCCTAGVCSDAVTQADCEASGGEYRGNDLTCESVDCTPRGACCTDGACSDAVTQADCETGGGEYRGDDLTCEAIDCTPRGACCTDGACSDAVTQADCEAGGGEYQGDGADCDSVVCSVAPVFLRGDHDGSGTVNFSDAINLLTNLLVDSEQHPVLCADASDTDNSGQVDFTDAISELRWELLGQFPLENTLPGPFVCGPDPDFEIDPDGPGGLQAQPGESLGCEEYTACP